jgi:hypothetical protein
MRPIHLITVAGLGCALVLAACGSSSKPNSSSASTGQSIGIKYSDCMRSHGVPNFPDPGSGGGIQINSSSGINPSSPAFQAAQKSCGGLLPGGGPGKSGTSETRKLALLHLAQCMRSHGFTTFPDPTSGPPSAPPAGGGLAFGGPGGFISIPQSVVQSPGFQKAATACGFPGAGRAPGKTKPLS